ncbi:hypothetical protein ACSBR2_012547 [Camellia fascicularis]
MKIHIISYGLVFFALMLVFSSMVSGIFLKKVHVYLINQLEPEKTLNVHCKSKDDDLGPQQLSFNQTYEWTFHNNFFDRTLFWCEMDWQKTPGIQVSGSFNIYKGNRDQRRCGKRCSWKIEETGLYSFNDIYGYWENLYNWP